MMGKSKLSLRQQQVNLLVAKALFFSTAMSSVGWQRFQNNFYLDKGFTSYEIGQLKSFGLLFKFIGEPFWCFVADLTDPKIVFILSILTSVLSMEMLRVANPLTYNRVLFVKALRTITAPAATLTTAASFKLTEGTNEGYGRQRMFGSLAWGSGAFISGILIDSFGMTALFLYTYLFIAVNFCCVMYGMPASSKPQLAPGELHAHASPHTSPLPGHHQNLSLSLAIIDHDSEVGNNSIGSSGNGSVHSSGLRHVHVPPSPTTYSPSTQSHHQQSHQQSHHHPTPSPPFPGINGVKVSNMFGYLSLSSSKICSSLATYFHDMKTFYSVSAARVLLLNTFVYGLVMTIIDTFMYVSLEKDFGASRTFSGACTAASILSCLPVFYYSEHLLVKHGHFRLIHIAQWTCVIRLLLLSMLNPTSPHSAYAILGIQLLHGLNFALFWSAAVDALFKLAPKGLTSSCLSTLNVMYFTLSGSAGNLLWGYIYSELGSMSLLYLGGAVVLSCMLLVFQLFEFSISSAPTLLTANASISLTCSEYPSDGNEMWTEDTSPPASTRRRDENSSV
jgi:predicted MFS family arabinose efflux permease